MTGRLELRDLTADFGTTMGSAMMSLLFFHGGPGGGKALQVRWPLT